METKILPFKESIISYTPNMDHFLSVLENNHDLTFPWILENYIELIIRKDIQNPPVFEFLDYNKIWWTCPFVHVSRIARDAFAVYSGIEAAVKKLIDKDFYLFFLVDTFYVQGYATYQREHRMHDIFIFGYEEEKAYSCDYFDFRKKSVRLVPFSQLEEGYARVPKLDDYGRGVVLFRNEEITDNIALYQYKESLGGELDVEEKGYVMDRNLVRIKLERFLESPDYVNSVTPTFFDYRLGYVTGFKVFEVLRDALRAGSAVIPKDAHLVCCHVRLMCERVRYLLASEGSNKSLSRLDNRMEEATRKAVLIKNLLIKAEIKGNSDRKNIIRHMDEFIFLYRVRPAKGLEFGG